MSFSEDHYISKLRRLNSSQRSIQTVSEWVMFHKKYSQESTRVWAKEMSEAPIDRGLVYLYLANEIIQTSRKQKITRFVESFSTVLPETIKQAYEKSLEKGAQTKPTHSIIRLIAIWKERHIFDAKFFQHLDEILRKMDSKYDVTAAEVPTTPQAHSQTPSETSPSASPIPSTTTSPVQSNTSISSNPASSSFTWDGTSSPADSLKRKREEESKEKQPVVKTAKTEPTPPTPTTPVATLSSYSQQSVLRVLVDAEQSYQAEELKYATRADEYLQQGVKAAPHAGGGGGDRDRDRGGSEREAELKAWTSQLGAATVGLRAYKTFLQAQIKKRKQLAETLRMHHDTQESAASRLTQQLRLCNEKLTAWQDASANAATNAQQASSIVSPSHTTRTANHPASHPASPASASSSINQPSRTTSSTPTASASSASASSSSSSTPSLFAAASPHDILQARQAAAAEAERAEIAKIRTLPTKINHTITSQRIPRLAALASQTNAQVKIDVVAGPGTETGTGTGTSPTTTNPATTNVEAYSPSSCSYPQSGVPPPPPPPPPTALSAPSTSTSTSSSTSSTSSAPRPIPVFDSDDGDDTDKLNSYAQPLPSVNLDFAP